jgi:hypothetical protein
MSAESVPLVRQDVAPSPTLSISSNDALLGDLSAHALPPLIQRRGLFGVKLTILILQRHVFVLP